MVRHSKTHLKLMQKLKCFREQVERVNESHSYPASLQIVKLCKQVQNDNIASNEGTGEDWMLCALDRSPQSF